MSVFLPACLSLCLPVGATVRQKMKIEPWNYGSSFRVVVSYAVPRSPRFGDLWFLCGPLELLYRMFESPCVVAISTVVVYQCKTCVVKQRRHWQYWRQTDLLAKRQLFTVCNYYYLCAEYRIMRSVSNWAVTFQKLCKKSRACITLLKAYAV
jgi:hypothetical protein